MSSMRFSSFHATHTAFQWLFLSVPGKSRCGRSVCSYVCLFTLFVRTLQTKRCNNTLGRYIPLGIPYISIYCEAQRSVTVSEKQEYCHCDKKLTFTLYHTGVVNTVDNECDKCKKLWFIHELTAHYTSKTAKITKRCYYSTAH